ncbi:MAG: hypothetical protein NT133_10535 [Alphaproteobacteria bacterium]|nr:hypothetical protein [Alphaproteobacteria bacterium]
MLFRNIFAGFVAAGFTLAAAASAGAQAPKRASILDIPLSAAEKSGLAPILNHVGEGGSHIHILPTLAGHLARVKHGLAAGQAGALPLKYHGGPVMNPKVTSGPQTNIEIYTIYWLPATGKLQSGAATSMAGNFMSVNNAMVQGFISNHLAGTATQYYQTSAATPIVNQGGLAGTYVDTAAYPASACTDTATPGNCLTDKQIQREIGNVMKRARWTPGPNKMFVMYTSSGQGSCLTGTTCAYTYYCAYHSSFNVTTGPSTGPVIYANMPYGDPGACANPGQATPNAIIGGVNYGPYADIVASVASHEILEAITAPFGNAWFDLSGNENADKCAYNFGANVSSSPAANQFYTSNPYPSPVYVTGYPASYFELQQEWSNAANAAGQKGCVQYYYNF